MNNNLTLEVITLDPGEYLTTAYPVQGWGERAQCHQIRGEIRELTVVQDGEPQFSMRIHEDGELILSQYSNVYTMHTPVNLRLTPVRPWKTKEVEVCAQ